MSYDQDAATTLDQLVAVHAVIREWPNSPECQFNEKHPMTEECKRTLNQRGYDVNQVGWAKDDDDYYIMYHLTQPPAQAYARI